MLSKYYLSVTVPNTLAMEKINYFNLKLLPFQIYYFNSILYPRICLIAKNKHQNIILQ